MPLQFQTQHEKIMHRNKREFLYQNLLLKLGEFQEFLKLEMLLVKESSRFFYAEQL